MLKGGFWFIFLMKQIKSMGITEVTLKFSLKVLLFYTYGMICRFCRLFHKLKKNVCVCDYKYDNGHLCFCMISESLLSNLSPGDLTIGKYRDKETIIVF